MNCSSSDPSANLDEALRLPIELWQHVFDHFDLKTSLVACEINHVWKEMNDNIKMWNKKY
jgi:hypothetical protein